MLFLLEHLPDLFYVLIAVVIVTIYFLVLVYLILAVGVSVIVSFLDILTFVDILIAAVSVAAHPSGFVYQFMFHVIAVCVCVLTWPPDRLELPILRSVKTGQSSSQS